LTRNPTALEVAAREKNKRASQVWGPLNFSHMAQTNIIQLSYLFVVQLNHTRGYGYRQYKKFINISDKTHETLVQGNKRRFLFLAHIRCIQVSRWAGIAAQATMDTIPLHLIFPDQISAGFFRVHAQAHHVSEKTFTGQAGTVWERLCGFC